MADDDHEAYIRAAIANEVSTLDTLQAGLMGKLRDAGPGLSNLPDVATISDSLKEGYRELAFHLYGRTVLGRELDENEQPKGRFSYRVSQANVSYIDGGCNILGRNSPLASRLVSAELGGEEEVDLPGGRTRILEVEEIREMDGPIGVSHGCDADFSAMTVVNTHGHTTKVTGCLREQPDIRITPLSTAENSARAEVNSSIMLSTSSDVVVLGNEFFTRTSRAQENALNRSFGVTVVEGVAGSGKTSVALGRLKFFSNFVTGEYLAENGLANRPISDFSVSGMVGYVRTHSLKRYLQDAAAALDMPRLEVLDFSEFIGELNSRLGLNTGFRLGDEPSPRLRTRIAWFRALDVATARFIGARMNSTIERYASNLTPTGRSKLREFAAGLISTDVTDHGYAVDRLFLKLHTLLVTIGTKDEHAGAVVRKVMNSLGMVAMFGAVVNSAGFLEVARKAMTSDGFSRDEVDRSVEDFRFSMANPDKNGRRMLLHADVVCLHALSALLSEGSDESGVGGVGRLYDVRQRKAVFIDEFQDFTEVELFLMSMSATRDYDQVTLAGDTYQMLQEKTPPSFHRMFPASHRRKNPDVFLPVNYRQTGGLASLSNAYRAIVQGDERVPVPVAVPSQAIGVDVWSDPELMVDILVGHILKTAPGTTVAVICPDLEKARAWHPLAEPRLSENFRSSMLSSKDELTKRNYVHFTNSFDSKGLEFDVVIVPDLGEFALSSQSSVNDLYVAISRARNDLLLGSSLRGLNHPQIMNLLSRGYIFSRDRAVGLERRLG